MPFAIDNKQTEVTGDLMKINFYQQKNPNWLNGNFQNQIFHQGNICALVIYIRNSIDSLSRTTKEVAIGASFVTNDTGMNLLAVISDVDRTKVPMVYPFVGKRALMNQCWQERWRKYYINFSDRFRSLGLIKFSSNATKTSLRLTRSIKFDNPIRSDFVSGIYNVLSK